MTGQATEPGMGWHALAACGGTNSVAFYEAKPSEAKAICGGCPVRPECLYEAVDTDAPEGIWGGLGRAERRALPVLPSDRTAAVNVLRQLLSRADAPTEPEPVKPPVHQEETVVAPTPAAPLAREDVAELLRQGHTQTRIMKQLGLSHRVVVATREAYNIPRPTGSGFRYSPERRAENERRTLELVRAGATYQQITDEVGISAPTIIGICRKAGVQPPNHPGGQPARSRAEVLAELVEPYGDGHARWTGGWAGRSPQMCAEGLTLSARRVMFEEHHGRPPAGRVFSDCGVTACIAGAHLTDHTLRAARPKKEEPVTVQALKDLLDEIEEQGGPQAARANNLRLTQPTAPMTEEPDTMTTTAEPASATPDLVVQPAVVVQPPVLTSPSEALPIEDLLAWGDEHPDTDVQDQAARARAAIAGLRVRHVANQELAEIAAEVAELETRLAELRAREAALAPAKKPAPAKEPKARTGPGVRSYDTSAVRAWAAKNNIDCPRFGKIPQRVLDAWLKAASPAGGTSS